MIYPEDCDWKGVTVKPSVSTDYPSELIVPVVGRHQNIFSKTCMQILQFGAKYSKSDTCGVNKKIFTIFISHS